MLRATTACTFWTAEAHLDVQKWSVPHVLCHFLLENVLLATTACTFSTSQLPKVVQSPGALTLFTSKCASGYNGVHFFNISTSKSAPRPTRFDTFTFKCASRACTFKHLNFQKCSDNGVFGHFLLQNVLRNATACTF